ncbi:MAG: hypothetical protein DRI99_05100, partial [Candidatus Aminicenantes bacterium]
MIAPEPFFQPRGTPISVYFRLKALSDLGHEIDLFTYPLGEDKKIPGVNIYRAPNILGFKKIKIGPSLTKIPLDITLFFQTFLTLFRKRYDLIFTHEEASWIGTFLGKIKKIPHLYDMHSSLPQQLDNFKFSRSRLLKFIFARLEKWVLRHSQAIIVICPDLMKIVEKAGQKEKALLLENFLDFEYPLPSANVLQELKKKFAPQGEKIVLYTGNFFPYQGIPLLLEAFSLLKKEKVRLLLVGGTPEEVQSMQPQAKTLGIGTQVSFVGQVPPQEIPRFMAIADALVSPRIAGTNTPLKIYSFLKSGKPIVATNLWTHTQLLDSDKAILVDPTPKSLAEGLRLALFDPKAQQIARRAQQWA